MSTTKLFETTPESQTPRRNYKNAVIGILTAALFVTGAFLIVNKNNSSEVIEHQQTQIVKVTDEKSDIQKSFDASLVRLDSMTSFSNSLQNKLSASNKVIANEKTAIRSILNKKNATAAELSKAKTMIADLNGKITGMEQQIAQLTQQNQSLTQDKVALTQDKEKLTQDLTTTTTAKQDLEKKVDVASTLNASDIVITPVKVTGSGKEKTTANAKHVSKMKISFVVDNRIAQTGPTDVYVCITGPDGKTITMDAAGAASFTTREEGDKKYTAKLTVDVEAAKKKNVEFAFKPASNFQQGNYTIQIYQNGFKIGEGTRELKKGGLFS